MSLLLIIRFREVRLSSFVTSELNWLVLKVVAFVSMAVVYLLEHFIKRVSVMIVVISDDYIINNIDYI